MSDDRDPLENLPGWTAIHDRQELAEHDPFDPAWLLIPAPLVPPIFLWLEMLTLRNELGELARGLEGFLVALVEPDTRGMVSCLDQVNRSVRRIILTAQEVIGDDQLEVVPVGDGSEEDAGEAPEKGRGGHTNRARATDGDA